MVDVVASPGLVGGIFLLRVITAKQLQAYGFLSLVVMFFALAVVFLPYFEIEDSPTGR